ncbi:hypothetical protein C7B61_00360 [filamentous cyanobacterium CCP1]|nr:hypothetical protein C7B76_16705 [filamentous cyanobacterium CCP2]PSB68549.1 hypothetical protein C7B61_00360 [filamentous cyanobacterium CCP1]
MRALNIWTEEAIQLFYDSWVQQQGMATVAAIYPQEGGQPTIYDLNLNGVQIVAEESEISEVNQS